MFKAILKKMNIDEGQDEQPVEGNSAGENGSAAASEPGEPVNVEQVERDVIEALKTIYDPEIPVNIYELGLIYEVKVWPDSFVDVKMTLTSPSCPVAGSLPGEVEVKVKAVPGVRDAKIDLVWEPAWNMGMMSEAAKLQLNLM